MFALAGLVSGKHFWFAAAAFACVVNLFNLLLPVAVLDGGRVIKSVFFSISDKLGTAFYKFGFLFLLGAGLVFPRYFPLAVVILFILFLEYRGFKKAPASLALLESNQKFLRNMEVSLRGRVPDADARELAAVYAAVYREQEREKRALELVVHPLPMSKEQIFIGLGVFIGVTAAHLLGLVFFLESLKTGSSPFSLLPLLK
jgi:membrane-associated protease RseP (regulator of RpoE activity)